MTAHLHLPNRMNVIGDTTVSTPFGGLYSVYPSRHVPGLGHVEHLRAHFVGGVALRLVPATAEQMLRDIPVALAALKSAYPDCSGAAWGGEQ